MVLRQNIAKVLQIFLACFSSPVFRPHGVKEIEHRVEGGRIVVEGIIKNSPRQGLVVHCCSQEGGQENCHPFCKSTIAPLVIKPGFLNYLNYLQSCHLYL